ncbi:hypothetical protein NTE10_000620 [Vibrio harveyi]|nr:hypothetical protein [Vibrio harveyi]
MSTVVDTLKNPFGMARLLEGYSTIKRAQDANLTDEQIRQVFPDTQKFDSKELDGFMAVGGALVRGDARFKGSAFSGKPEPSQ